MIAQIDLGCTPHIKVTGRRALQGAGIAFLLVLVFLTIIFSTGSAMNGKTFLQGLWEFFPLTTASVGGAAGGVMYYLVVQAWSPAGWKKTIAVIIGILMYLVVVWISLVAGFAATGQWD